MNLMVRQGRAAVLLAEAFKLIKLASSSINNMNRTTFVEVMKAFMSSTGVVLEQYNFPFLDTLTKGIAEGIMSIGFLLT